MKLNKCAVVFDPEKHEYWLGDKQLQGVTGILSRRLFADKYAAVPKHVLENAAKKGSFIHEMCDLVDSLNVEPEGCVEAKNYIEAQEALWFGKCSQRVSRFRQRALRYKH